MDGQHVVTYKIFTVALFHCMEWCDSEKKCNTLGAAYMKVKLGNVNGLECLTWAVYDGVYVPGDPPALTGYYDWEHSCRDHTLLNLLQAD